MLRLRYTRDYPNCCHPEMSVDAGFERSGGLHLSATRPRTPSTKPCRDSASQTVEMRQQTGYVLCFQQYSRAHCPHCAAGPARRLYPTEIASFRYHPGLMVPFSILQLSVVLLNRLSLRQTGCSVSRDRRVRADPGDDPSATVGTFTTDEAYVTYATWRRNRSESTRISERFCTLSNDRETTTQMLSPVFSTTNRQTMSTSCSAR